MIHVFFGSYPFKVIDTIVALVAINVIHEWLSVWIRNKRLGNKRVNHLNLVFPKMNKQVTEVMLNRRKYLRMFRVLVVHA